MLQPDLEHIITDAISGIKQVRELYVPEFAPKESGMVMNVSPGVATVSGLPNAGFEELLAFPGGLFGIAFNLNENGIGAILLGQDERLQTGDKVERTGRVMDVPVGEGLTSRVINPLGEPMDGKGPLVFSKRLPVERPAPAIMHRAPVSTPLQTGIKVIDAIVPVGRGQRELILGDRQTGKTAIAVDTILNQHDKQVRCIYCAIGQRAASVAKVIAQLEARGAMEYTTVVVTEGNNPPGLQYLAPYAATSIAEYFMERGEDVLIVYDDLTHHARAYRELSLLLRRPPGREAYPGDIFYIHSRLLERSTHLNKVHGGGSLTALPIVETEAQNISAYIPTNLISITDGQLYLSPKLFELGMLPAIDIGKSVSRVGGKAQLAAYNKVAGNLKLAYSQFEELETFARFGTHLDAHTKKILEHGKRIRECFKQQELQPVPVIAQVLVLLALTNDLFDMVEVSKVGAAEIVLRKATGDISPQTVKNILEGTALTGEDEASVLQLARKVLSEFETKLPAGNSSQ